jgi:outer membrane receptor for ferrienterochelin and colicins
MLVGNIAISQVKTDSSISLKVDGLCEQCKHRIEQAVKINGVDSANWDIQSKILSITYDTTVISLETIQQKILAVGHDVANRKATPAAYNNLPSCCRYRELSAQTDTLQKVKQLSDVNIISNHRSTYVAPANPFGTQIITGREFLKSACCNLSESFETNPSVDVSYNDAVTGSKQIQLLGLSGIYTQLTVENLPGPRGLAIPLGLNSIPGPWIESIQLTKGIGSVVNGYESIAGQINIEMKKPETSERLYANAYINDMGKTDINLNLSQKINAKWSTALLLHDDFLTNNMDMNNDGFRDLPTGNQINILNRWKYDNGNRFMTQFGVNILNEDRVGGQVDFDPATDKLTTNHYGLGFDIQRYEGFAKIGYIFPDKRYKSIGLQLTGVDHTQNDYFGLTKYDADQKTFYSNLIYQSIIGTTNNSFKTGISFSNDHYNEQFNTNNYRRTETTPGAFFEYTYNYLTKFTVVAGIRADQNSLFGWFATPRLNVRYAPFKGTTIRISGGRGQRTANIFAENTSAFVSSRQVDIIASNGSKAYGLNPEIAWNEGISANQDFKLFHRDASLNLDFFRNDFINQVVVDLEDVRKVKFYNLQGQSYSNSLQAEFNVTPLKDFDVKLAYRYYDVNTTYSGQLLQRPFISKDRAFINLAYNLKGWKLDYTINYNGKKRLPDTKGNPAPYQLTGYSPDYVLMNAQISKTFFKKHPMDLYAGCENITGYIQNDPIIAADQPFSQYFDASLVWAPITGRMFYAGWRLKIK